MPTLRLEKIAKIYKDKSRNTTAILDIDLTIEQGEFVFITGSRGAGKSTLMEIISGDLKPDRGAVYLDNVNLSRTGKRQAEKLRQCMGMVMQDSELIRTETVMRNLMPRSGLDFFRRKMDGSQVSKALALVGMAGCEEKYPREIPSSDCRRIELARAIMNSPDILLLDDLTDRMDEDAIWDTIHLLTELNKHGTTVIMATTAVKVVNIMRKRVITLSDGKVVGDVRKGKYGYIV